MVEKFNYKSFDLSSGRKIAGKYEVLGKLGAGWEGEVYKVRELATGIDRAAKLFFPHRNIRNRASTTYARKLHDLRFCSMLIQYHTKETMVFKKWAVTVLVSEYVDGFPLSEFLTRFRGNRMDPYRALHLLYSLCLGLEEIHLLNQFHGDLHSDNILVNKYGLGFEIKVLDLYPWTGSKRENMREDIVRAVEIFRECLGGGKYYAKQPRFVKEICYGMKRTLILKNFPSISHLREHIETLNWI